VVFYTQHKNQKTENQIKIKKTKKQGKKATVYKRPFFLTCGILPNKFLIFFLKIEIFGFQIFSIIPNT